MGQVLHGSATTTEAIRRAIQHSQESLRELARRYGINQKTVAKWKKRTSVTDVPTGPKEPRSTVLSIEEEAIIVAFRRHTLLPLDDCLYALQPTIPHLTRSSLHRCLQRHGIDGCRRLKATSRRRRSSRATRSATSTSTSPRCRPPRASSTSMSPSIARANSPSCRSVRKTGRTSAAAFLTALIEAVPYKIHTVLTDNGIQFTFPPAIRRWSDGALRDAHVRHALPGERHRAPAYQGEAPWTNGQVERMNRTIKEATVQRYHYDSHRQLEAHLADFVSAYNFGRRLKTLKGLTPYEFICKIWTKEPERFNSIQSIKCRD